MMIEEKIAELETNCKAMTDEVEKLKAELAEKNETVWIPKNKEDFLCVYARGSVVTETYYDTSTFGNDMLRMNDVFKPTRSVKKHLGWYRDNVLRIQNKLMQLHELLCPDYFPDWSTSEDKWLVYYDNEDKCFICNPWYICNCFVVCFTKEAAEKACEILNREKFMVGQKEGKTDVKTN